ncbi:dual specificity protein phosphatase [Plasmodium gonderi]|uniref:protein-tyrosine-phosphatase n=1 Tax=Plasmodium gonderi TaxID=77519 RepID=A0A1Y1JER0_PLAGO|nr:dual specificity protein phosphatase [Plasmodium gonderi]GAW80730.1 dual specificity protein phosphatase [Plasmodium gonderi]
MIVKVFDNIYISNVYNANDIYHLINLNIGGVLTCFRCMSIEWCYHNPKENGKIFYKDKFLNCKKELPRDVKKCGLLHVQQGVSPSGKTFKDSVEAGSYCTSNMYTNIDISRNRVEEAIEENGDTSKECYLEQNCDDIFSKPYAHYDHVIYPYEVIEKKLSKDRIDDYIKGMVLLPDDVEVDCFGTFQNESMSSLTETTKNNICGEQTEPTKGTSLHTTPLDADNTQQSNESEKKEMTHRSSSMDDKHIVSEKMGSNRKEREEYSCNNTSQSSENLEMHLEIHDVETEKTLLQGQDCKKKYSNKQIEQGKIQTVCELNKTLRVEKNKTISPNNVYKMKHMYLDILDTFDENILKHVHHAHSFIDDIIKDNKNVLVHCMAGISRCSSIILSYISKKNGKTIADNFATLKSRYPFAHPNENFYRQLLLYEKMNYSTDGPNEFHRIYEEIKCGRAYLEQLKCLNLKNAPDATYKFRCKFCRFTLFTDNDIIQHDLKNCKIKKNYGSSCTSIFIEKKEWLLTESKMKGVLNCPQKNCNAKLGKWSWSGICCSCGYLQIPAFMINESNVDRMKVNPS